MSDETLVTEPGQSPAASVPLYSPAQAAWGTMWGGPAVVVYFLYRNYIALGDVAGARKTLVYGGLVTLAYFGFLAMLPVHALPAAPVLAVSWFVTRGLVESLQLSKAAIIASPGYTFQPGWRVLGMSTVCALVTAVGLITGVFVWYVFHP